MIREFGILNTNIPEDHEWFGSPYPGMYFIGKDGFVFDKSFIANHRIRESVNDIIQEDFQVKDMERGEVEVVTTSHLIAKAYFASPTIRREQLTVLTVEISLEEGMHIYGRPLPEGYIPVELTLDDNEDILLDRVDYPQPQEMDIEVLGERLPVYTNSLEIKAHCLGVSKDQEKSFEANPKLSYQACDDHECYLPQRLTFSIPLQFLSHDWKQIEEAE